MRDDLKCAYCAFPADGYDHLVPISRQTTRRRRGKMASVSERVPCCALCNSLLGDCPAFRFRDRAAVLLLRYADRPREEAYETWLKVQRLFRIVAGFELETEIEEADERNRRRFSEMWREDYDEVASQEPPPDEQRERRRMAKGMRKVSRAAKLDAQAAETARARQVEWLAILRQAGYMR